VGEEGSPRSTIKEPAPHHRSIQYEQGGQRVRQRGRPIAESHRMTEQSSPAERAMRWLGANVRPSSWPCARAGSSDSASSATVAAAAGEGCGRIGPLQDTRARGGNQHQRQDREGHASTNKGIWTSSDDDSAHEIAEQHKAWPIRAHSPCGLTRSAFWGGSTAGLPGPKLAEERRRPSAEEGSALGRVCGREGLGS